MIRYRAAWVLPICRPPIRDGWVDVDQGRIAGVGGSDAVGLDDRVDEVVLGHVAVMPGLVNAHTHLELSYLRDRVPAATEFVTWIRGVMDAARLRSDPSSPEILRAVDEGIREAAASGTSLVGDISNTLVTVQALAASVIESVVFHEIIRFKGAGAETFVDEAVGRIRGLLPAGAVRPRLAAHAPYSVAPAVFRAIQHRAEHDGLSPWSVHLAESAEEVEFIRHGTGPWRSLLEEVGSWDPSWAPEGGSPVEYLDRHRLLDSRLLAVHGVQMSSSDLARLAACGTTLVTCPRSNVHTGAGAPPIEAFYASGVRLAVGTDSLASAPDLNVFSELAAMHALAPGVPASSLLDSATRQGARALGFEGELGAIEAGHRARLLAVSVPGEVTDVEAYLVGGIEPGQVRWVP